MAGQNDQNKRLIVFTKFEGSVINKRTLKAAPITPLGGEPMEVSQDEDPRQKLVDWMAAPGNPFFARAVANRYWAHFFGRGIVDPIDNMRLTNPPSNPELLVTLWRRTSSTQKFSLKHLVKTIVLSRTLIGQFGAERVQQARPAGVRPLLSPGHVGRGAVRRRQSGDEREGQLQRPADRQSMHRTGRSCFRTRSFPSYFLDVFSAAWRINAFLQMRAGRRRESRSGSCRC